MSNCEWRTIQRPRILVEKTNLLGSSRLTPGQGGWCEITGDAISVHQDDYGFSVLAHLAPGPMYGMFQQG